MKYPTRIIMSPASHPNGGLFGATHIPKFIMYFAPLQEITLGFIIEPNVDWSPIISPDIDCITVWLNINSPVITIEVISAAVGLFKSKNINNPMSSILINHISFNMLPDNNLSEFRLQSSSIIGCSP